MCFGGIGVIRELVQRIGLVREIDDRLDLFKRHLPYRESDHILNVAYNILCGGGRLEDLNRLRSDVPYMEALGAEMIPSPTAAGDFMRRFTESNVLALMEAFNAVRPRLWRGRGRALPGPVAYVDIDGTVAPTQGRKKTGVEMSYKGIWGYHPLIISLANTGEGMTNPVFLKGLGAAAMMGVVYWVGRRRGRKKVKRAISELARMV